MGCYCSLTECFCTRERVLVLANICRQQKIKLLNKYENADKNKIYVFHINGHSYMPTEKKHTTDHRFIVHTTHPTTTTNKCIQKYLAKSERKKNREKMRCARIFTKQALYLAISYTEMPHTCRLRLTHFMRYVEVR